ncbi:class I SAM-dependent methyltransferase [Aquabacterium sp.]|uniref:class I SAM-dependent methyltransferase n=1 Tax=Aquabacterium sp. TaxID=1872578 RepID=UPI002C0DF821|nr:methyltransferase domain-containing protein [Aquabacterium sp.]HSW04275.1 methyltransferase domain-containing protein [Aquabacterium sp.]
MNDAYIHGYLARESTRLQDQADTLAALLHEGTAYPPGSRVLEAGCGVGAQTLTLARRSPDAHFTSFDISAASVAEAARRVAEAGLLNVQCLQADLLAPPFAAESFDHLFVCFVLEHLPRPVEALAALRRLLRPGGSLTVIEGDHGATLCHPAGVQAQCVIDCQVELQRRAGGNALIGRQLYPLISAAGFAAVQVQPRIAYADASRPGWVDGFTHKTFIAMIEGVRDAAIAAGLATPADFDTGLQQLRRTTEPDGSFCYSFFKATAIKPLAGPAHATGPCRAG